jgi:LysM domain
LVTAIKRAAVLMHRLRISSFTVLLAGFAATAAPLRAQQGDAPRTHEVKKGDTLWDLAKQYLGDSFLWPEIYRLNTDKIEDPHWIYPGETLKLPSAASVAASAASTAASAVASTGASNASSTAPARRQQGTGQRMTVFNPNYNKRAHTTRESLSLRSGAGALRAGEYAVSPFMWSVGGPTDGGVLEEAAEAEGVKIELVRRPIQYLEPVFVHLPNGAAGKVGDQFIVYRLDSVVAGQGQAVVPTGVIKLLTPAANGRARAQLTQQFEDVFPGQSVTPLDTLHLQHGVMPVRTEFGLATHVTWLNYDPVLPGSGNYLIFAAGSGDGLVPGDQISLLRNRGFDSQGTQLPDEEVAVAEVTRVTKWGAAAIILKTYQPGVAKGMRARVTAKMP